MVASAVIFGLGDSRIIGLSPSSGAFFSHIALVQTKRSEQNAPRDLGPTRLLTNALGVRPAASSGARLFEGPGRFSLYRLPYDNSGNEFCLRLDLFESPRAPPLMDPPLSC